MSVYVKQELCTGFGVCAEACNVGAIHLEDHRAVIDTVLCTGCEACVDACPNGAITTIFINAPSGVILKTPDVESSLVPARTGTALPEKAVPARGLASLVGTAMAFLGSEVTPHLVDILMNALERRLARPAKDAVSPSSIPIGRLTAQRRGKQRQARYRGRQMSIRNLKERR